MSTVSRHRIVTVIGAVLCATGIIGCREGRELSRDATVDAGGADDRVGTDGPTIGIGGTRGSGGSSGSGGAPATGGAAGGFGAGGTMAAGGTTGAGGTAGAGGLPSDLQGSTTHAFGDVEVGTTTPPFTWTITNAGSRATGALVLVNEVPSQIVTTNNCTGPLAAGASCTVTVAVHASLLGALGGAVTVTSGSQIVTFTASGSGKYRLTVTVTGVGRVKSMVAGLIDCATTCTTLFDQTVTLQATTLNGSGYFLSGWSAICSGPVHDCKVAPSGNITLTAVFSPMVNNLIFVSSQPFPVNGGVAVFDTGCNALATAAGINTPAGNGYIAFVSSSTSPVKSRLPASAQGWVRMDGRAFAGTQASLFMNNQIYNAILYDETGLNLALTVFTGTLQDGSVAPDNCNNWTTNAETQTATVGQPGDGPGSFTNAGSIQCSYGLVPVICMGTTRQAAIHPLVTSGKKIWLTNSSYSVGGGQTPDAACNAVLPPGVTTAAALIAYTSKPASSVLVPTATYVRPDGTLVGTGSQLTTNSTLESGAWQSASGAYLAGSDLLPATWTGSSAVSMLGTTAGTCADWTDPTQQQGTQGVWSGTTFLHWWYSRTQPCDGRGFDMRLYCVQTTP